MVTGLRRKGRGAALGVALAGAALGLAAGPAGASAAEHTETFTKGPITVGGYEVQQSYMLAPHPKVDGFITKMQVNMVDEDGHKIPIRRLMLHHIVFSNLSRDDETCNSFLGFDNRTSGISAGDRFFARGEEGAQMVLPDGYGYRMRANDVWGLLYMVMNHRPDLDHAYIRYRITYDTDPSIQPVTPYWLDVRNCRADPIYNVPGTGGPGSTDVRSSDVVVHHAGRVVAAGGHVHGGARRLTLTEPDCGNREIGRSIPTWGLPGHPFYHVRPVLHEPGPVKMSAFNTETGIPVEKGQVLRLNSEYDNSQPHTRVMGIMIAYLAKDPAVSDPCGPLPDDIRNVRIDRPGRRGPVPFRIPLTGLDENGHAQTISAPPGKLRKAGSGATIAVSDRYFDRPNLRVRKGSELTWQFGGSELHNVTLANGPEAIGSPNLDGGRNFSKRFRKPGTYRLFCALHPTQMQERIVVKRNRHHHG